MHGLQLLHNLLSKSCSQIHTNRLASLLRSVEGLLSCSKLTLVNIGRNLSSSTLVKHKIKQIDRLLGNPYLHQEKGVIYQALTEKLITSNSRPVILVDWSGVTHCGAFHMIRASIPFNGRSLIIYEEVHPENKKDNPKVNQNFLKNLARIVPKNCVPIVVTDAGFRNPWFKAVSKLNWHFIGRVRNITKVCEVNSHIWKSCKGLYKKATYKAQYVGEFWLAKTNPLLCKMYLFKEKRKNRKKQNLKGHKVRCSSSLKHAKRNKEPWLIATSLASFSAKKIIQIYKLRMTIEQGFRDVKNTRNGFCLRETRSSTAERLSILLLIGALATFIVCIYGQAAQLKGLQYQYQTNSVKHKTVLSWFFLGICTIKGRIVFPKEIIHQALNEKVLAGVYYF